MNNNAYLNIVMFGNFDIIFNGKSILPETTGNVKVIALLKFLLSNKEKLFTAEAIVENVWPENEYVDEKKVIRTYIHRLRKVISAENNMKKDFTRYINILNTKGGYKIEISPQTIMDTDIFEKNKEAAYTTNDQTTLLQIFETITNVFNDEFLVECRYDHWVMMLRNYYLHTFSSVTEYIISKFMSSNDYSTVIKLCEKALKVSETNENLNILYLQALIETNQITAAQQRYNYITAKLYLEQSIPLSEKFRTIHAQLKKFKNQNDALESFHSEAIDKYELSVMINEAVKNYLSIDKPKYSIAYIEVLKLKPTGELDDHPKYQYRTDEEKTDIQNSIKYAFEHSLRKKDMYLVSEDGLFLSILYDTKEEFYNTIINRISNAFYSRYTGYMYKITIKIHTLHCVE